MSGFDKQKIVSSVPQKDFLVIRKDYSLFSSQSFGSAAAQALNAQHVKFYTPENEMMYFGGIGGAAILLSMILFALSPKIQSFMKGIR
jgi:dipeptide/tripeptide permease